MGTAAASETAGKICGEEAELRVEFSQTAGSQCGRRRPEEDRLHIFPQIPLREGSFDPLLSSQGSREGGHAAHSLQPRWWDGKLLCSCWDLQPCPLWGVMDEREGEEEEAVS